MRGAPPTSPFILGVGWDSPIPGLRVAPPPTAPFTLGGWDSYPLGCGEPPLTAPFILGVGVGLPSLGCGESPPPPPTAPITRGAPAERPPLLRFPQVPARRQAAGLGTHWPRANDGTARRVRQELGAKGSFRVDKAQAWLAAPGGPRGLSRCPVSSPPAHSA